MLVGLTGLIPIWLPSVCSLTSILLGQGAPSAITYSAQEEHTREAAPNTSTDIPMRVHLGLPIVDIWINGSGPFSFGIDTGAMDLVVVSESLAAQLGAASPKTTAKESVAVGIPKRGRVSVESIRIGDLLFSGISAKVGDLFSRFPVPIDGVLGLPLFTDVLLTLDYPARRVRIERAELPKVDGITILPVERHPTGLALVELEVEGKKLEALVDTGNLAAVVYLPKLLVTQLEWASESSSTRVARTAGGEITIKEVKLAGVVRLGPLVLNQPVVVFGETFGKAIIGGQAFSEYVVSIDQRNLRMRLIQ